ncbi:hypothetical protein DOK76_10835 [Vagococcus sp. DIV0080]|uniref:ABC transporter permease n=1 Tax=Candidatus Vagococcus giribetii TaxID=2230876 RepID=A0ABS3HWL1_9ENTE|nr:hypothetical protein [Vagococcus sp. DIV0080]MBO0477572.1 hypothetical protein [Vagococcus sp. DIV0080]
MTNLKQSFKAARYHKRMSISLFVVFSLFLMCLAFLSQLLDTQKMTLNYLLGKWDQLKTILPQFDTELNKHLLKSNDLIVTFYDHIRLIILLTSFIAFFLLSVYFTKERKEELYSLSYIGIKRREMLPRLLLELIFPVIISLPVILCAFLVFHNQIINESIQTNQKVMNHYFQSEKLVKRKDDLFPDTKEKEKEDHVVSLNSDRTLLPYNRTSILDVKVSTLSFNHVFSTLIANFCLLFINMIVAYSAGFYCYTTFAFKKRRFAS